MTSAAKRRVAIVTGTRAEFGLLQPVMRAVHEHPNLELLIVAAGSHMVSPARTFYEVQTFARALGLQVADAVPMQIAGRSGRVEDAEALGLGLARFARGFDRIAPSWVVVLGDRIEAFAAASAASVGGWGLAHIHGGDRAMGVADEAMRHAITKLAHLHLAATKSSAARIAQMGEKPEHIKIVGSPAIDALADIAELTDTQLKEIGLDQTPQAVLLLHPVGRSDQEERQTAVATLTALHGQRVLALAPNLDAGREGIAGALKRAKETSPGLVLCDHLPRERFIGLLRRLAREGGVLVGNSSAGLIEAAALRLPVVDIGRRQEGRERGDNVVHAQREETTAIAQAIAQARALDLHSLTHPYGDGRSAGRIAAALAQLDPRSPEVLRKRCVY